MIHAVSTHERIVALTFDDGPNDVYTPQLLQVLADENVVATFFVVGKYLERNPDVGRAIVEQGHQLASHGWDGQVLAGQSIDAVEASLLRTDAEIFAVGGPANPVFRPAKLRPGVVGREVCRSLGKRVVGASVLGWDWLSGNKSCVFPFSSWCPSQDAQKIAQRVVRAAHPGAVIVLHDGSAQGDGADRSGTLRAVPLIVKALSGQGYRFVTVDTLLEFNDE